MDTATIQQIPISQIIAGANDRVIFKADQLASLAASIKSDGLIEPPIYRDLGNGTYRIVVGERRTRAMRDVLGWQEIPAIVRELTDEQEAAIMGAENLGRVDLGPIEEAQCYQARIDLFGWTVKACAERLGVSENKVTLALLLLACCDEIQDLIGKGIIGLRYGHAIGRSGLNRNFQLRAAKELADNKAPTIQWFGALIGELQAAQNAPSPFFDLDALTLVSVQATKQADPPLPGKQHAPTVQGTAVEIVQAQIAYWHDAAAQWTARGYKRNSERCQDAAQGLAVVATALSAALSPATAPEPICEPTAPIDPLPMLLQILATRQPKRETGGLQIEAYTPFRVKGKIQAQRCDGLHCKNLPAHRVTSRNGAQLLSRLLCSECLECVTIGA